MAARGPDGLASDEKAGANEMALLDAGLYAPIASSGVAHGRKAAIEHGTQPRRRSSGEQGERHRLHETDVHLAVDDVHVAIDEAGHQRAPAAVDHGRVLALDRGRTQLAHAISLDEQLMAADELAIGRLEELEVAEQDLVHGLVLGLTEEWPPRPDSAVAVLGGCHARGISAPAA